MRVVVQRVSRASVSVDGEVIASIGNGLLLLVGVAEGDSEDEAEKLAKKCAEMRIFADDEGKFNRSVLDASGEALVVSQFTLLGDVRRGRRPSFAGAARPEIAEPLVKTFVDTLIAAGVATQAGVFGARMEVELVNDGPVTIIVDSDDLERPRRGD